MAKFSAVDSAFSGFGLIKQRPGAVLSWAVAALVFQVLVFALLFAVGGTAFAHLQALQAERWAAPFSARPDPNNTVAIIQTMWSLWPALLLSWLISLGYYAAISAAVVRVFLSDTPLPLGGLRLGADEFKLIVTFVTVILIGVGIYIAAIVIGLVASFLLGVLLKAIHAPALVTVLVSVVGAIAFVGLELVASLYVPVRLSLSLVATVAEHRIGLGRSWRLTRGRFWPLFGAYLLTVMVSLVVFLVLLALLFVIAGVAPTGGGWAGHLRVLMQWPDATWSPLAWAVWVIVRLVGIALTAAWHAVLAGPTVEAYRAFSADSTEASA
jgi:hypothetical protein